MGWTRCTSPAADMADWKVPLADVRISEEEISAVADTYRSGWLSMGPQTERFEAAFAEYLGVRHAFATASGTASLHLLLAASGLGPGDEVVVPSMTFVATVNAIAYTGATPVFCDIAGLARPWISAELAEARIGPQTKAILTMPYGGHPGATKELVELAATRNLLLLIDAAHAVGARIGARALGSLGDGAAFSFFSNKNLAIGEGGMVVTNADDVAERLRLLRSHGMTTLTWDRHRGHASTYDVVALGYNYRVDEPRATLGRLRLERIDDENGQRAVAAERYRAGLVGISGLIPTAAPETGTTAAHHLFTVVLDEGIDRDAFRASVAKAGVQTSVHYPPVHHFATYSDRGADLPLTEAYGARTVTLPLFAHIDEQQVDAVIHAIEEAARAQLRVRVRSAVRRR
jgi:dTDP-4-amino-4,6-dideoxygalactose transaminase